MKTLKNVETMYRDYEAGSIVILEPEVNVDSLKSFILDAMEDIYIVLKAQVRGASRIAATDDTADPDDPTVAMRPVHPSDYKKGKGMEGITPDPKGEIDQEDVDVKKSETPGSRSKLVGDSEDSLAKGDRLIEEDKEGYRRTVVSPGKQGDPGYDATQRDFQSDFSKKDTLQRMNVQNRKERDLGRKSISSEDAAGIIETILSIKPLLKSFNPSDHKTDELDLEADKHEEMEKLREDLNKEEDKKKE